MVQLLPSMPKSVVQSSTLGEKEQQTLKSKTLVPEAVAHVYNLSICQEYQKEFEPVWEERGIQVQDSCSKILH